MVKHQKNNSALYYEFCILRILLKSGIINKKAFDGIVKIAAEDYGSSLILQ
jgi:hypothetical protein